MSENNGWLPIETAQGQDPRDDTYAEVLLSDGELRRIGWIMRRGNGENRGMVSGHIGHVWTHFQPLPPPPETHTQEA